MTRAILEWHRYRYFPYERDFARLEVKRLLGTDASEDSRGLHIPERAFDREQVERLTYFARGVLPKGEIVVPHQAKLEASAHVNSRDRQATRYSAHGLHEYKGKFNPQVVRAIGNMLGIQPGGWILDPFCGSGTTLLEAEHSGWNAIGVDRNPLAVRIANAKTSALRGSPGRLTDLGTRLSRALRRASTLSTTTGLDSGRIEQILGNGWLAELPHSDYLLSWFARAVLAQIVAIRRAIWKWVPMSGDRNIFEVVLSDLLREVSLQEPADLRIRRRGKPLPNYPVVDLFESTLLERLERIERARKALKRLNGHQQAHLGDIRTLAVKELPQVPTDGFDAIITSPPYETALPYIDTQRLSLVLLGEIAVGDIHHTDRALIGSREIGSSERKSIEQSISRSNSRTLPTEVLSVCRELLQAAEHPSNGFRRRNRPALAYRYFDGMAQFFLNVRKVLKRDGKVALVVGTNRTVLGGKEFQVDTPQLLCAIAKQCGFELIEQRSMDTYPRYELHQRNSINSERLIVLGLS